MTFEDYRRVFDYIDHDSMGEINFNKFCLLNTQSKRWFQERKGQHKLVRNGKPPLRPLPLTHSQPPKNKNV